MYQLEQAQKLLSVGSDWISVCEVLASSHHSCVLCGIHLCFLTVICATLRLHPKEQDFLDVNSLPVVETYNLA